MKTKEEISELLKKAESKEGLALDELYKLNFEERALLWELAING